MVFQRLDINGDAIGRADFILPPVQSSNTGSIVINRNKFFPQIFGHFLCQLNNLRTIPQQWQDSDFDRREIFMETEDCSLSTGHLFLAIPCVDAQGIPTTTQTCTVTERQFSGCTASGCHGDATAAQSAYTTAKQRIDNLVVEVDALLAEPGPAGDLDLTDGVFTVADGAWFNARLGALPGTSTHNPFLAEQLLVATIAALKDTYNLPVPITGVSLDRQIR